MTQISEHHSEQEGESNLSENCGIDFLVHGDTIGIDDFLEGESKVIDLDIGGWLDGVVGEFLEVSGGEVLEDFLDGLLIFIGTPEIPDVGSVSCFHQVQLHVQVLFFRHEPLVHFQRTDLVFNAVSADLVNLHQVALELLLGVFGEDSRLLDALLQLSDLGRNAGEGRQLESLTHERIADSGNLLSDLTTLLEDHDVD